MCGLIGIRLCVHGLPSMHGCLLVRKVSLRTSVDGSMHGKWIARIGAFITGDRGVTYMGECQTD